MEVATISENLRDFLTSGLFRERSISFHFTSAEDDVEIVELNTIASDYIMIEVNRSGIKKVIPFSSIAYIDMPIVGNAIDVYLNVCAS